jgi:hypothetical protein
MVLLKAFGAIEIGIGGDLSGLRGRQNGRSYDGDFQAQFAHLKELLAAYDPAARIQFIESPPPVDLAEEFGEAAAAAGMPVRQFTSLYVIGGNESQPDALDALRANLALAKRTGTVERLNMQVWGTATIPAVRTLVDFYLAAEELAQAAGIELFTETHIDRFTYDPRRLVAVHEALLDRTGGRLGLRVAADLSHYVHQIGNPHFANWPSISSGALNINPLDLDNAVSRHIIGMGLVGYGHLRMAVPNQLPPNHGSIQYPVADPALDPATAHLTYGGLSRPWEAERMQFWLRWYRQIFLFQNIAMVSFAQRMIRQLQQERAASPLYQTTTIPPMASEAVLIPGS